MKPIKKGGTQNLEAWLLGDKVTDLRLLKPGDILLQVSHQFDSQNLCRITRLDECGFRAPGQICYGLFVNPSNTQQARMNGDHEFAIWDFDLTLGHNEFFRVSTEPPPMSLTGAMVASLMRKHKVTIRSIKERYPKMITMKRVREVRAKGVKGFAAEEWFYIITGKWPVKDGVTAST
ncbi:hypothetical protein [Ottowia sp.]|uniref:hypothetical protein n=1 Tax=Ottowia sp. TaxID=1898956 RepID=UPI0025ED4E02|nr:hypothetical protein [Ottowia sp.]MBK6616640.1 hypothetical protein [Ottowia sp.]